MKRLFFILALSVWPFISLAAQELPKLNGIPANVTIQSRAQSDHLAFKGIPIDGDIDAFSKQLVNAGYTESLRFTDKYIKWFEGLFMDEKCFVGVMYSPKGLVGRVTVEFSYSSSYARNSAYNDAISLYRTKYGSPGYSDGDVCIWDVPHGGIVIGKDPSSGSKMQITYEDSKNGEIVIEERNAAIKREKASKINDI